MSRIAAITAAMHGRPGPDCRDFTVDEVHAFLRQLVEPCIVAGQQDVPLIDALGRVLAQDVVAPFDVPPHDNSAMDGFAFDGAVLAQAGNASDSERDVVLRIVGTALAGAAWKVPTAPGEAVRIMTGAMMPHGLDTVVPQELCEVEGDVVRFPAAAAKRFDNRRLAGEDLMQGRPALLQGSRISPAALGLLGSLGIARVPVRRRLRVAYFSTGDEILAPGDSPREGAVYDSNRYTITGLLTRLGCDVIDCGSVRDDPLALESTLRRAATEAEADAIVTSGGVSAGDADHTRAAMQRVADMAFWRIAMRPGRPMAVGLVDRAEQRSALLFGLPGNPVAAMVTFLAFVRPALLQLMGCHPLDSAAAPLLRARSAADIRKKPGRTEYQRGHVRNVPGALPEVRIAGNQGSGVLSSMVEANGLVVLRHAQGNVVAGEEVDVMMFEGVM